MKQLKQHISEKLLIRNKPDKADTMFFPETLYELKNMIYSEIEKHGLECSLNHICTSKITSMNGLFDGRNNFPLLKKFNGDISLWDVSNVKNMSGMFEESDFDGDISLWDVSKVETMESMFDNSKYTGENGDICEWDISSVYDMSFMFYENTKYKGDISNWDVSKVKNMDAMFKDSSYDGDISMWDIDKNCSVDAMLSRSQIYINGKYPKHLRRR
jgi:surface protein